jgi:septal ring factor EnvC (AmiA/AmiB activator)
VTKKNESIVFLILGSLLSVVLFSTNITSQDHEQNISSLKSETHFCASRSISSENELSDQELELKRVCENQRRIDSLKNDISDLETEKEKVLKTIEDAIAKQESEKFAKERTRHQIALMSSFQYPYHLLNSLQRQYDRTPAITYAYSPFHDHSTSKNMNYLKVAMTQRLSMKLRASESWSPNWDTNGHLTNPIYGNAQTWQNLEDMHRLPLSSGFMMRQPSSNQFPSFPIY